ncbi:hypothetical protein EDB92DRAFT_1818498 [Lactarius akahatsu]|uniref:Uncharacterized protein n=1 Tax=Lactarius akahatsu TaxID=416441 RepID=A0AAD4LDX3_9AGAM|nr:hypothetical protein EDB92DRAFT_1818498 [Lactarius akahatsu]
MAFLFVANSCAFDAQNLGFSYLRGTTGQMHMGYYFDVDFDLDFERLTFIFGAEYTFPSWRPSDRYSKPPPLPSPSDDLRPPSSYCCCRVAEGCWVREEEGRAGQEWQACPSSSLTMGQCSIHTHFLLLLSPHLWARDSWSIAPCLFLRHCPLTTPGHPPPTATVELQGVLLPFVGNCWYSPSGSGQSLLAIRCRVGEEEGGAVQEWTVHGVTAFNIGSLYLHLTQRSTALMEIQPTITDLDAKYYVLCIFDNIIWFDHIHAGSQKICQTVHAPPHLPVNAYDPKWLESRETLYVRHVLCPKEDPYRFDHPPDVIARLTI